MRVLIIALLLFIAGCSTELPLDALGGRRSDYESYLNKNLQTQRLFLKLKETALARALKVTPELIQLQNQLAPGFEVKLPDATTVFVVSLEMQSWARFSISDFKFYYGDVVSSKVKEIMDEQLIKMLYPYAVPFDRIFTVEFANKTDSDVLKIQTSQGQFLFNYKDLSL